MMVAWLISIIAALGVWSGPGSDRGIPCRGEVAEWSSLVGVDHVPSFPIRLVAPYVVVSGPVRVQAAPLEEMDMPAALAWIRSRRAGGPRLVPGLDWKVDRVTTSPGRARIDLSAVFRGQSVWALVLVSRPTADGDHRIVDAALVEFGEGRIASWRGQDQVTVAYRWMVGSGGDRLAGSPIRLLDDRGVFVARSRTGADGMATLHWSGPGDRLLIAGRGRRRSLLLLDGHWRAPGGLVGHLALSRTRVAPGDTIAVAGVAFAVTGGRGTQGGRHGRGRRQTGRSPSTSGKLVLRLVAPGRHEVALGRVKWGGRGIFAGRVQVPSWVCGGRWRVMAQDPVTGWTLHRALLVEGRRAHLVVHVAPTSRNVRVDVQLQSPWRGPVLGARIDYRWGWRRSCSGTSDLQGGAGSTCLDGKGRASVVMNWPMQDVGCLWVEASTVRGGNLLMAHDWWSDGQRQGLLVGRREVSWRIMPSGAGWSSVHVQGRGAWAVVIHHGSRTNVWPCWSASPWSEQVRCPVRTIRSGEISLLRFRSAGGWMVMGRHVLSGSDQPELSWPRIQQRPAMLDATFDGDDLVVWPDVAPAATGVGLVTVVCGGRWYRRSITNLLEPVSFRLSRCFRAQVFVDWASRAGHRHAWRTVDGRAMQIALALSLRKVVSGRSLCLSASLQDRFGRFLPSDMAALFIGGGDAGSSLWLLSGTPRAGFCFVPRRAGAFRLEVLAGAGSGRMAVLSRPLAVTPLPHVTISGPDLVRISDRVCLNLEWTGRSALDSWVRTKGWALRRPWSGRLVSGHRSVCGVVGRTKSVVSMEVGAGHGIRSAVWRSHVAVAGDVGRWRGETASFPGKAVRSLRSGSAQGGRVGGRLVPRGRVAALACSAEPWVRLLGPALRIVDWDGGLAGLVARVVLSDLSWWDRLIAVDRLVRRDQGRLESRRSLLAQLSRLQRPDGWFEREAGGPIASFHRQVQVAMVLLGLHADGSGRRLLAVLAGHRPVTPSQAAVGLWAQARMGRWDGAWARRAMGHMAKLGLGASALLLDALARRGGDASVLDRVLGHLRNLVSGIDARRKPSSGGSLRWESVGSPLWPLAAALDVVDRLLPGHALAERLADALFRAMDRGDGDALDRALSIRSLWGHWQRRAAKGRQDVIEASSRGVVYRRVVGCSDDAMILTGSELDVAPVSIRHRGDCLLHCALFWHMVPQMAHGIGAVESAVHRVVLSPLAYAPVSAGGDRIRRLRLGETVRLRLDVDLSDRVQAGTSTCLREILPGGLSLVRILSGQGSVTRSRHGFDICSEQVRYHVTYDAVARFPGRYRGGAACVRSLAGPVACSSDWRVLVVP